MLSQDQEINVTDCQFLSNSAANWHGGGMYNHTDSSPHVAACVFDGNTAADVAGGLYNYVSCNPTFTSCVFQGNLAEGTPSTAGGVRDESGSTSLYEGSTFIGNAADFGAGSHAFGCNPTFTGCTFEDNIAAQDGGGMLIEGGSAAVVRQCVFTMNQAASEGGGIHILASSPTVRNCLFTGNSSSNVGGGLSNWNGGSTIANSTFAGNTAASEGGLLGDARHDDPGVTNTGTGAITYADIGAYEFQGDSTPPPPPAADDGGCAPAGRNGSPGLALVMLLGLGALLVPRRALRR